jgi:hypothetical protein
MRRISAPRSEPRLGASMVDALAALILSAAALMLAASLVTPALRTIARVEAFLLSAERQRTGLVE